MRLEEKERYISAIRTVSTQQPYKARYEENYTIENIYLVYRFFVVQWNFLSNRGDLGI